MEFINIDMNKYKRQDHYTHFKSMQNPFITLTVQIDITDFLSSIKENGYPFFLSFLYKVASAANKIPELRQRIRENGIIEYKNCLSSYTVLKDDDTYRYCLVDTDMPIDKFISYAKEKQKDAINSEDLVEEEESDNIFYISCLPWINYTQLSLPYFDSQFSIPNISWGKYYSINDKVYIPVTIMVNHALADGYHVSKFFAFLQDSL